MQGKATNCHSFKLNHFNSSQAHRYFTSITKTLEVELDEDDTALLDNGYGINFSTTENKSSTPIKFEATILGETLHQKYQVSI